MNQSVVSSSSPSRAGRVRGLRSGVLLVAAVVLASCASGDVDDLAFEDVPAEKSYNEGIAYVRAGNLSEATKKFEEVDRAHPYSAWARKSLIMTTYTNYSRGNWDEAITSGRRFVTLYPGSEDAAYAQFMIGMSYFNQIPDIHRDQEITGKAMQALTELVQRYPDSPYAAPAQQRIDVARDQLAGKEMETGRYYLNRLNYVAAINRFRVVVTDYQTTRHVEESLMRLTEAYFAMGVVNEAQTAAAVLGHNFPESRWYKDAYTLLQTNGLEPREDGQSWISQAFKSVLG
ncbi:outer membrane protein assembly factor BamD [Methylobrevis albus]|uniref:Outer membrane protein assembly factor BamD n=1 Tax=Methylobrevis albus TaxID=2793297 RepID=A0A931HZR3_9HYPH|nr:outer membrane protein assembly factor BamD [Methylobrevis albus]